MTTPRKREKGLSRAAAMDAVPHPMTGIRISEEEDGAIKVGLKLESTKWQKRFGAPPEYERQYVLDPLGREVLEACDGTAPVRAIAQEFARHHKVSIPEAEISVTTFLKTLMAKGIIRMVVEGPEPA